MVSIPSDKSEELKKKGEVIDRFLLCPPPPLTAHPKSRLISSYNPCFLPRECTARSNQNKEMKNVYLKCSFIQQHWQRLSLQSATAAVRLSRAYGWMAKQKEEGQKLKTIHSVKSVAVRSSGFNKILWMFPSLLSSPRTLLTAALKRVATLMDIFGTIWLPTAFCSLKSRCLAPAKESFPLGSGCLTSAVPRPP